MYGKPGGVAGAVLLPATGAALDFFWLPLAFVAIVAGLLMIRHSMLQREPSQKDPPC